MDPAQPRHEDTTRRWLYRIPFIGWGRIGRPLPHTLRPVAGSRAFFIIEPSIGLSLRN